MSSQATGLSLTTIELTLPQERLVRVLVIDDDMDFLDSMQSFFASNNYSVDLARSPEEAAPLLKRNEYELVIADINFGDMSEVKGDHFVLNNQGLLGKAKRVVITGEWLSEERYRVLERAGIVFLEKGDDDLSKRLVEVAQEKAEERTKHIVQTVERQVAPSIQRLTGAAVAVKLAPVSPPEPSPADVLKDELKQMLIEWLDTRGEPDEPVLAFGKHVYSANDMICHIKDETTIGVEHLRLLISEIKFSLGLDEDDTEHYEGRNGDG
jgi:CheY-like chemotaxis protein